MHDKSSELEYSKKHVPPAVPNKSLCVHDQTVCALIMTRLCVH